MRDPRGIDRKRIGRMQLRMDWRSVTFDWNRARAFLVTAEEGSLSAAARALNMAQPTLGRQVSALEEDLGVTLFERVGRGLELTQAGTELLAHVRAMGSAAQAFALTASGQAQAIEGHVAITASEIYSMWLLPEVLRQLRERAPGITVEIVASNTVRDLKRREADIAIRNTQPREPDLIARRVAHDRGGFFATPGYLEGLGPITDLQDLLRASFVGFDDLIPYVALMNEHFGLPVTEAHFPLRASSHAVHWELARKGLAIGAGPEALGRADPSLVQILPESFTVDYPVWLVAHREVRTSPRVRLVWEVLAETLPRLLSQASRTGGPQSD